MLRVIEAVEGPLCLNDCVADPPQCPQIDTCPVYPYLDRAQDALRALLTVTLADLERDHTPPLVDFPPLGAELTGNGKGTAPVPAVGGEA